MLTLEQWGLILNIVGTLLVVFFFGKDDKECVLNENGRKYYALLMYHPNWLIFGVGLLVVGFVLSFIGTLN